MWFLLSLLALSMQVSRRSAEKSATGQISSLGLSWLQQAAALPFIIATLFFAQFYLPSQLSQSFWQLMALYVVLISIDVVCYFKALSISDVSYVAPLLALTGVGSIIGSYFILGQVPSFFGICGALLIVAGAVLTYRAKAADKLNKVTNRLALILILVIVLERSIGANIEVFMLRESNPTTFNFYSSLLTIPLLLLVSTLIVATSRSDKYKNYWSKLGTGTAKHKLLLLFIGLTYTINMLATYQAKLDAPTAGYVTAVKSASVLPMVIIGVMFFKEKIVKQQWYGLALILVGLVLLALN